MKTISKILSVVLCLAMVVGFFTFGAAAADNTYTKVNITAASDITEGYYLIFGTTTTGTTGFLSTTGATTTRMMSADLTVSNNSVSTSDTAAIWKLTAVTGGFTVQNVGTGKYLYYGNNSGNNIYSGDESAAGVWKVITHDDVWTLEETASGRQLSANNFGSDPNKYVGFAAYADNSSTQRSLEFYKLASGTVTPPSGGEGGGTVTPPAGGEGGNTETVPLTNGMKVVIYAPGYTKALSSTLVTDNFYQIGVDVTVSGSTVTGYSDTEIWTVVVNSDGSFSFEQDGQKLGMQDEYSSMSLGSVNDKWEVISLGNGLYNIKNTVRGNMIEWYSSKNNWSTYNSSSAATDPQFQLSFYEVVTTGGEGGGTVTPPAGGEGGGTVTPPAGGEGGGTVTPPAGGEGGGTVTPPAGGEDGGTVTPPAGGEGGGTVTPPAGGEGGGTVTPPAGGEGSSTGTTTGYFKVTDGKLTSGKYVMVVESGYAAGVLDGTWVSAVQPTISGNQVVNPTGCVWTLTVNGSKVTITDENGKTIYNNGKTNMIESDTAWNWKYEDGKFYFYTDAEEGSNPRYFSSSPAESGANRWRAYYLTLEPDSYGNFYYSGITLYKQSTSGSSSSSGNANTGDNSVISVAIAAAVLSVLGTTALIMKKKEF